MNLINFRGNFSQMIKILSGLLCILLILTLSKSNNAAPDSSDQESKLWKHFLTYSNEVMVSSRGLEIYYKQIPTSKINTSELKSGKPSNEVRKYLANFARIVVKQPVKTNSVTLFPGNYSLGLEEEKLGTGRWLFFLTESNGKLVTRMEPVFEALPPAMSTHVITLELDRKAGSNLLKIRVKLSDLSISTKDALEL